MAYAPTTWVDAVTPVNAANLNKLEQGLATLVTLPADTVVPAATRIIANKFLVGDALPAFRFYGDGKIEWGPGGATPPDTTLYRVSAGVLKTDGHFLVAGQVGSMEGGVGAIRLSTSTGLSTGNPMIYFGSALDVNLYRVAPDCLKTDDTFEIAYPSSTALRISAAGGGIYFGGDILLYRSGARSLTLDATLQLIRAAGAPAINVYMLAGDANAAWKIDRDGAMNWGAGGAAGPDTNLYRSAAGNLKTDGKLDVAGVFSFGLAGLGGAIYYAPTLVGWPLQVIAANEGTMRFGIYADGAHYWGPGTAATDTTLYRNGAAILRTNSVFQADGDLSAQTGSAERVVIGKISAGIAGIYFGSGFDTSLSRAGVNVLNASGDFIVNKTIAAASTMPDNNWAFYTYHTGDSGIRFIIRNNGQLNWGPGDNTVDLNLYRVAASTLQVSPGGAILSFLGVGNTTSGSIKHNGGNGLFIQADNPGAVGGVYLAWSSGSGNTYVGNGAANYGALVYGTLVAGSDLALKEDIRPLTSALDTIKSLRGVRFQMKAQPGERIGLIAQEVEQHLPELVSEHILPGDETPMKGVDYVSLIPVLIEAIKELSTKVEAVTA